MTGCDVKAGRSNTAFTLATKEKAGVDMSREVGFLGGW